MLSPIQRDSFRLSTLTAVAESAPHGLDLEGLHCAYAAQGVGSLTTEEHAREVESIVSQGWLSKRPGILNKHKHRYHLTDAGQTVLVQHGLT